jgi:hypothetical protein
MQLAATERLRRIQARLDATTVRLLEDLRWCGLAKRLGVHPCTAKRRAIAALRRSAQVCDGCARPRNWRPTSLNPLMDWLLPAGWRVVAWPA